MHENAHLIESFYKGFQRKDAEAMAVCYHDDVRFSDPVFPDLRGADVGAMWRMLCERGKDLQITFDAVDADDEKGEARWEAHYTFSRTGRRVHNRVVASFRFQDGKIVEHRDAFDFWRWTRMALGPIGAIMGWTPLLQGKVQRQSAALLAQHQATRTH